MGFYICNSLFGNKKEARDSDHQASLGWCHQESNRGHMDFQSIALPTELWHLLFGLQIYYANPSNQIV